uniref:Uncharacterized protein n=1 Tax=viral metagenome TaxID=1070528 RepID=A0A6C0F7P1_9ZZZZ
MPITKKKVQQRPKKNRKSKQKAVKIIEDLYLKKTQKKQIQELIKNAKENYQNAITYEKIPPKQLDNIYVLDENWKRGRRNLYKQFTIAQLAKLKFFSPIKRTPLYMAPGHMKSEKVLNELYKTTKQKVEQIYPREHPRNSEYSSDMNRLLTKFKIMVESPYTKLSGKPVKFSKMYNASGYNGKFDLLKNMIINKNRTVKKIASFYDVK